MNDQTGDGGDGEDWSDGPTAPGEDWTDQNWPDNQSQGDEVTYDEEMTSEGWDEMGALEQMFAPGEEIPEGEKPIEMRASEAEKLYANLLMVTDFEREFIEEMLEFEPDEASKMRIDELRRKRREMKELAQEGFPPNASPHQPKTILL